MPIQIPCGSAIETAHVHYGSFSVFVSDYSRFLKLIHQSLFLGDVSVYCQCCLNPEIAGIFQSSPNNTLLEESQY